MNYTDVRDIIYQAIRNHFNRDRIYDGKIGVTSAIACLRKSLFRYYIGEDVITDENWGNIITGQAIHEFIQKLLSNIQNDNISFDFEVRVEDDLLVGYIDAIMTINGKKYLLEFKSARDMPTKPFSIHIQQLNTYLYLADKTIHPEMGFIVYLPKTAPTLRVYRVTRNPEMYHYVVRRAEILKRCIENQEIPPAEYTDSCWFCTYAKVCRAYNKGDLDAKQILRERKKI